MGAITLRLKIDQKPCIIWSLGPKTLKHEDSEPQGKGSSDLNLGIRDIRHTASPGIRLGRSMEVPIVA